MDGYGRSLLTRHERRQEDHRQRRPQQPAGLFAAAKRGTYEIAAKAWEATRAAIEKRIERLSGQIDRLAGFMRRAFPWEPEPSPGERLAERKAEGANPALATEARAAIRQANIDEWARLGRDIQHQQEGRAMMDGTRGTTDAGEARQRREAEQRARLERDGRLAARQDDTLAAEATPPAKDATAAKERQDAQRPDAEQERRTKEARERIRAQRDKEREDRDRPRGRGR